MMRRVTAGMRRFIGRSLPQGSVRIGVGLGVLGVTSYGFTILSGRVLGPELLAPLSALWAAAFTIGPGLFLPIEQEVSRSLSARAANGVGGLPVVRRAVLIGATGIGGLLFLLALSGSAIVEVFFAGEPVLLVALVIAVVGSPCVHMVRGILSGTREFGRYGLVLGAEGLIRFGGAAILALVGIATVGPYGVALGIAPLAASLIGIAARGSRLEDGPTVEWSELSKALGWLLAASVFAQLLVNGAPLVAMLLATPDEAAQVGSLFTGLVLARVPVFVFAALQAALLPDLSAAVATGDLGSFRRSVAGLFGLTAAAGVMAVVLGTWVGPAVIRLLFGPEFVLRGVDIGLLTAASVLYVLGIIGAQSLIALDRHAAAASSWGVGLAGFAAASAIPMSGLVIRVEVAFVVGAAVGLASFGWQLHRSMRGHVPLGAGSS